MLKKQEDDKTAGIYQPYANSFYDYEVYECANTVRVSDERAKRRVAPSSPSHVPPSPLVFSYVGVPR